MNKLDLYRFSPNISNIFYKFSRFLLTVAKYYRKLISIYEMVMNFFLLAN